MKWWFVDLRYTVGSAVTVPIAPAFSASFVNGVWTGEITVQQAGTNVVLEADDRVGHTGASNPFDVHQLNDLWVSLSAAPDPISVGETLTKTVTVRNSGPASASGVTLTDVLPAMVSFVSASASQGSVAEAAGTVSAQLGTLAGGANATVTIVVTPNTSGTIITSAVTVTRTEADPDIANNTAMVQTTVNPPLISIPDASIVEGNSGTTDVMVVVSLSAVSAQTVQVDYATVDGTALQGSDYLFRSGTLVFPPGTNSQTLSVAVKGDILIESNETFFVTLSAPVNATLGRSQGLALIENDDGLPGQIDHFAWDTIASPQRANDPVPVTITVQDAFNNTVSNYTETVAFSARGGGGQVEGTILGNVIHTSTASGGFYTDGYAFTPNADIRVTHVRHYYGQKVSIWTDTGVLLAGQNVSSIPGTWQETPLANPVQLQAGKRYRIGVSYGAGTAFYWREDGSSTFRHGTIDQGFYAIGDQFPTVSSPAKWYFVDLRYTDGSAIPISISPTNSASFVNGVWTGEITVQQAGTNVVLQADDGAGHVGASNPFEVWVVNDLSLSMSDAPDPAEAGENLTYTISVTNSGPAAATGVIVSNTLPGGVNLVSAVATQGSCTQAGSQVICNVGTLAGSAGVTITIVVVPSAAGSITNQASVTRNEADPVAANNTAFVVTQVKPGFAAATLPFVETWESGTLAPYWVVTGTGPHRSQVTTANGPHGGSYHLTMDSSSSSGSYARNEVTLGVNLAGYTNVVLRFWAREYDDESEGPPSGPFIGGADFDGVAISVDGQTWYEVQGLRTLGNVYSEVVVNLDAPVAARGLAYNSKFRIRFNHYDDNPITTDGIAIDDIRITGRRPGVLDHFEWSGISSPQSANVPFAVTVAAQDSFNNTVSNFTGTVALTARAGGESLTNSMLGAVAHSTAWSSSATYTGGNAFTPNTNIMVTHVRHYFGSKVSVWTDGGVLLASQSVVSTPGTWLETPLATPLLLAAGARYRVGVYADGGTYYWRNDGSGSFSQGTIDQGYEISGDAFPNRTDLWRWWLVDLRYTVGASVSVPITPAVSGNFVNGLWSGAVTVLEPGTNIVLRLEDSQGHTGFSPPFTVVPRTTVSISRTGASVLITWPAGEGDLALQEVDDLTPPVQWRPVSTQPLVIGDQKVFVIGAPQGSKFYRLIKP